MKTSAWFSLPKRLAFISACAGVLLSAPTPGHAASGSIYMITSNPENEVGTRGFAGFLRGLGYTVTVGPGSRDPHRTLDAEAPAAQAAKIAELESYNPIIIHRRFGSRLRAAKDSRTGRCERSAPLVRALAVARINVQVTRADEASALHLLV